MSVRLTLAALSTSCSWSRSGRGYFNPLNTCSFTSRLHGLRVYPLSVATTRRQGVSALPTVRYCPLCAQKSGIGDRQDAGDSGSCPMKTGPMPEIARASKPPDKREVGRSTLPKPIYERCKELSALRRFTFWTPEPTRISVNSLISTSCLKLARTMGGSETLAVIEDLRISGAHSVESVTRFTRFGTC
jgi:hypothetical protein